MLCLRKLPTPCKPQRCLLENYIDDLWGTFTFNKWAKRKKEMAASQLPQDGSVNSRRLAQHWQMLPNQSLPSALTGTEDRTVLYWTEVESGAARAVERIDQPVNIPRRSWPKTFCWLLFVSVSSSLPGDCSLASALVSMRPCGELSVGRRDWVDGGNQLEELWHEVRRCEREEATHRFFFL